MKTPLFSIIVPTYNRRKLLQRAIESVLAQRYTNWELILIDDGSSDDSKEYIDTVQDGRLQYYYKNNGGVSSARNLGILKASGRYICFLDSDDELQSNYLESFNSKIDDKTKVLCCGLRMQWEDRDKQIDIVPNTNSKLFIKQVLTGNFNLMPFCFKRAIITSFAEEIEMGEDLMFIIPLILKYKTLTFSEVQCVLYEHKGRFTRSKYETDRTVEFKTASIETIEQNRTELEKTFSSFELDKIIKEKLENYILGISQHSFSNAMRIWNSNKTEYHLVPLKTKMVMRRIKYVLKNLMGYGRF